MANGISDILSVYRETLASERQSRMGEMQMALSMMQYESERVFREEGRRREDVYQGLTQDKQILEEAMVKDVNMVVAKISGLFEREVVDGETVIQQLTSRQAKKIGLTDDIANELYTIVWMSGDPDLAVAGREAAIRFSRRIAAEYDNWKGTGVKSNYLKALTKAGILYGGERGAKGGLLKDDEGDIVWDDVRESLSFGPFTGISKGLEAQEAVNLELSEIKSGDYMIQRQEDIEAGIKRKPLEYGEDEDLAGIADYVKQQLELEDGDEDSAIAEFGLTELSTAATKRTEEKKELKGAYDEFKYKTGKAKTGGFSGVVAIPDAVWNKLSNDPGTPGLESAGGPNIGYIPTDNQYQRIKESLKIMLISYIEKGRNELAKDKALKFVEWTESRNELLEQRGRTGEVVKSMDKAVLEALGKL